MWATPKIRAENHDVPTTGHVGISKTMNLIKRAYCWRGLRNDVAAYVRLCAVCHCMKPNNWKKASDLQPIPLPKRAWQQMTNDLVIDVAEPEGKNATAVFVDRVTR